MAFLQDYPIFAYLMPMVFIWCIFIVIKRRKNNQALQLQQQATESGLTEPASLHPIIDPNLCLGCGACTRACPEGNVLGLINGKAQLIQPSNCIGHGACKASCPTNAITLVFGTETRGVDIPTLSPNFETNVAGIFIAGELGGMGLIRNAVEQGSQAASEVTKLVRQLKWAPEDMLDVVVVGAGPAGIAASLSAKQDNLNFVTIEQDSLGGTVSHFPRNKIVMTAPVNLPLVGKVKFRETSKEALLEFWQNIIEKTALKINFDERLEDIETLKVGFKLTTNKGQYFTKTVLLGLGRRGTPRTLNVEGEALPKVVYRLIDPGQYTGQKVLVVGGGDSALEAATSIAEQAGSHVILSYRSDSFNRAKSKNRQKVEQAERQGQLTVMLRSSVKKISPDDVVIEQDGKQACFANDAVIVCAGGILPTPFLQKIGISIETKHGSE
ncbi:NAD(P)-binding domain-containing protein [Paraglaciecola sp. MB-3u-78]|uniref:NAD(P)-binding domain-containing protein n=1 Tax=Paraglaciecola sp. MB-3u-78 TaxID=2058332 RepID=UPI000C31EB0D|nr:NAD(P)-binding domain-containing protein [Paraglaciecola sp. MB-3u-78]PKG99131.1 4Fe-4S ferredoxin [Paraglaciecola sp. MB-3u-78]